MTLGACWVCAQLLIVYSDTGGGHKASANAICAAFEHIVPGQIEVKTVDVIEQYSLWPSNRTYSCFCDIYVIMINIISVLYYYYVITYSLWPSNRTYCF